jgi:mxaK protein
MLRTISLWFAALLMIAALIIAAQQLRQLLIISEFNDLIDNPQGLQDQEDLSPEQTLIRAGAVLQQDDEQQALSLYHSMTNVADEELRSTALYNLGVIYLRLAAKHWNAQGVWANAEVLAPLNLAKDAFKQVLRINPNHQQARYNMDYALRITPPPKEPEVEGFTESRSSVHAVLPARPSGGP